MPYNSEPKEIINLVELERNLFTKGTIPRSSNKKLHWVCLEIEKTLTTIFGENLTVGNKENPPSHTVNAEAIKSVVLSLVPHREIYTNGKYVATIYLIESSFLKRTLKLGLSARGDRSYNKTLEYIVELRSNLLEIIAEEELLDISNQLHKDIISITKCQHSLTYPQLETFSSLPKTVQVYLNRKQVVASKLE